MNIEFLKTAPELSKGTWHAKIISQESGADQKSTSPWYLNNQKRNFFDERL